MITTEFAEDRRRRFRAGWAVATCLALAMALVPLTQAATAAGPAAGETFTQPGVGVGGSTVRTVFSVTREPGATPGEVSIGDGSSLAIPGSAAGAVSIPETIEHDGQSYRVTAIADRAFRGAVSITTTGLAENRSVESIGHHAFAGAAALIDTGLAVNTSVTEVGTGAFASTRSLLAAALPSSLTSSPSVPFSATENLESVYLPASVASAQRVGLTRALPVYHRSTASGWASVDLSALSLYGPPPSELVALSEVRVSGGTASATAGSTANPYLGATGLFAGAGVRADGTAGRAADSVTVTASDQASFRGWRATGLELTSEQQASPVLSFSMPASDVSIEAVSEIAVETTVTPRCVGGKVYLSLSVKNTGPSTVGITVASAFGQKTVTGVAPGKTSTSSWNTRASTTGAGAFTVTTTTADGRSSTSSAPFAAHSCGVAG